MHEGRMFPMSSRAVSSQAAWRHHVWLALLVVDGQRRFSFVAACATPFAAVAAVAALTLSRGDAFRITVGALAGRPDLALGVSEARFWRCCAQPKPQDRPGRLDQRQTRRHQKLARRIRCSTSGVLPVSRAARRTADVSR